MNEEIAIHPQAYKEILHATKELGFNQPDLHQPILTFRWLHTYAKKTSTFSAIWRDTRSQSNENRSYTYFDSHFFCTSDIHQSSATRI